jgi:hypothetical protein
MGTMGRQYQVMCSDWHSWDPGGLPEGPQGRLVVMGLPLGNAENGS